MADVAESAVLVSSAAAKAAVTKLKHVQGPSSDFHNPQHVLNYYPSIGFQATNFGCACHIAEAMLRLQPPSRVYRIKDGKYVLVQHDEEGSNKEESSAATTESDAKTEEVAATKKTKAKHNRDRFVHPNLFLGVTANLMGTGCREAVRFLVQEGIAPIPAAQISEVVPQPPDDASEAQLMFARLKKEYCEMYGAPALYDEAPATFRSFVCAVVVSGGGVEHDVRRACAPYTVGYYASEGVTNTGADFLRRRKLQRVAAVHARTPSGGTSKELIHPVADAGFGNISYPLQGSGAAKLFDTVMQLFVRRLCARQHRLRIAAAAKPIPEKYLDVCSWSVTPSEVWALLGLWLVDILAEALHTLQHHTREEEAGATKMDDGNAISKAKSNVTETAAADAAAMHTCASCRAAALEKARTTVVYWAAVQQVPLYSPSFADGDIASYLLPKDSAQNTSAEADETLQLDLVRDIHSINKLAMQSKKSGMLICGGGVVKHHVCNANLMRNGADYTIILNNGQEFDGSDAGAKPEEALSWGKVRMEGQFVKVYGEITTYLPLLVAQVFVPAVRRRNQQNPTVVSAARAALRGVGDVPVDGVQGQATGNIKSKRRRKRRYTRGNPAERKVTPTDSSDVAPAKEHIPVVEWDRE